MASVMAFSSCGNGFCQKRIWVFSEATISSVQANMANALRRNLLQWTFSNVSGCWIYFLPSAWPVWWASQQHPFASGKLGSIWPRDLNKDESVAVMWSGRLICQHMLTMEEIWSFPFFKTKKKPNTCLHDTFFHSHLADFSNAGWGTVVQVRQIATKSCRLLNDYSFVDGRDVLQQKVLTIENF